MGFVWPNGVTYAQISFASANPAYHTYLITGLAATEQPHSLVNEIIKYSRFIFSEAKDRLPTR
jgi:hypothetical protein